MSGSRFILIICALLVTASCDHATREEVSHEIKNIEKQVEVVSQVQVSTTTDFSYAISAQQSRVEWVESRQIQAEQVMEVMGDGFNVLTESLQDNQTETQNVARRQARLEQRVENKFKPVLTQVFEQTDAGVDDVVVLLATGEDIRTGQALETLRLVLDDPPILRRVVNDQDVELIPTQEIGDRLYALPEESEKSFCLQIIRRSEESPEFSAADCGNAFWVWEFRVE